MNDYDVHFAHFAVVAVVVAWRPAACLSAATAMTEAAATRATTSMAMTRVTTSD
jgi:hypothetical protein